MRLSHLSRFRLSRTPLGFWLAVALLALLTGLVVAHLVGRAAALADRYGPLRPVVVAARPVERGAEIEASDVALRQLPAAFLPPGAMASVAPVVGRTAVVPLLVGQVVMGGQLAPEGLSGVAALLPPGTRAVAVPAAGASGLVRRGDVVDVLATFDPAAGAGGDATLTVAADALVVDAGEDAATVAVTPEEAKAVAFAVSHGTITLAVTPGAVSERRTPAGPAPPPPPAPGR